MSAGLSSPGGPWSLRLRLISPAATRPWPRTCRSDPTGAVETLLIDVVVRQQPSESEQSDSGTAIALDALVDRIPELMVVGTSLIGGDAVSVVTMVAVFISNVPENLSSAAGMRNAGSFRAYVFDLGW